MATYTKCDRCGDSTETKAYLKFYSLVTTPHDDEYEQVSMTKEICKSCAEDLKHVWMHPPRIKEPA